MQNGGKTYKHKYGLDDYLPLAPLVYSARKCVIKLQLEDPSS
jgi:hypothetical protein